MAERITSAENTVTSAARTATGSSAPVNVSTVSDAIVMLTCTAASGTTPTLDVKVQASADTITWYDEGTSFTQITAASTPAVKKLTGLGLYIRYFWTIAGTTPSFTFSIQTVLSK